MVKRLLALSAVLLVAVAGPAYAGEGYTDEDTVTVSDTTATPGQPITVSAKTFEPGSTVTFSLSGTGVVGTAVADSAGVATLTFDIPADATVGAHTVEASGTGADGLPLTVSTTIEVLGAAAAGDLPTTGSANTLSMTQLAVAAVVGGGLLVLLANKRRSAKAAAGELTSV